MSLIELGFKPPFRGEENNVIDANEAFACSAYPFEHTGSFIVAQAIAEALNKAHPVDAPEVTAQYTPSRKDAFVMAALTGCSARQDLTEKEAAGTANYLAELAIAELYKENEDASVST